MNSRLSVRMRFEPFSFAALELCVPRPAITPPTTPNSPPSNSSTVNGTTREESSNGVGKESSDGVGKEAADKAAIGHQEGHEVWPNVDFEDAPVDLEHPGPPDAPRTTRIQTHTSCPSQLDFDGCIELFGPPDIFPSSGQYFLCFFLSFIVFVYVFSFFNLSIVSYMSHLFSTVC